MDDLLYSEAPPRKNLWVRIGITAGLLLLVLGGLYFLPIHLQARLYSYLPGHSGLISLATGSEQGTYELLGSLVASSMAENEGFAPIYTVRTVPSAGSTENLRRLWAGETDFALLQGGWQQQEPQEPELSEETDPLQFLKQDRVHAVASLQREYLHLVVPASSPVQSFRDLAGQTIYTGPPDSGAYQVGQMVIQFYDLDIRAAAYDIPLTSNEILSALNTGQVSAVLYVYGLYAPLMERVLKSGDYRLVPFDDAEALARYIPGTYVDEIPSGAYGPLRNHPQGNAMETLAVNTLLAARSNVSRYKIWAVLESIYTSDRYEMRLADIAGLTEAQGREVSDFPIHPAAEAFYRRHDPVTSDAFEIGSFCLATVVALASGLHFWSGRAQRRELEQRRDNILPYFSELMRFEEAIGQSENPDELHGLLHDIMQSHRQAERAWLQGELDTEHVENLYSVYAIRTQNAFHKIISLHMQGLRSQSGDSLAAVMKLSEKLKIKPPASKSSKEKTGAASKPDPDVLPHMLIPPDKDDGT
jgi:hypothetical protein